MKANKISPSSYHIVITDRQTYSMQMHAHAHRQRCNLFNETIHQQAKRALKHKLLIVEANIPLQ